MTTILYRRARIKTDFERSKACQVCGKEGKIDVHHYKYEFKTKEVKKNPSLVTKNTIQVCFACHMVADAVRIVREKPEKAEKIKKLGG